MLSMQIKQRLEAAIMRTYFSEELLVTHNCKSLLRESNVDKKSADISSNCIYQYTCTCGSRYIGRTERILSTRISKHLPTNVTLNGPKLPSSAIGRHIIDSVHVLIKRKYLRWPSEPETLSAPFCRGIRHSPSFTLLNNYSTLCLNYFFNSLS